MISIAVDAMGGDNAPREIVHGAVLASKANPVRIFLVGDESTIKDELKQHDYSSNSLEIIHTPDSISMDELPIKAMVTNQMPQFLSPLLWCQMGRLMPLSPPAVPDL